ncbi:MAG TPA: PilZ domain-containing protein [Polyangia bacterium]|nr:PilZ domain-containing protein [Polyangia bacterium]
MAPEDDSAGGGSERRSAPRIMARSLVEVRLPTWEALRSVYTINISQGGIRLQSGARAPLGTPIDIILTLPDGTRLHLAGKVAHLGAGETGDVGVRFDALPERTQQEIDRYLKDLQAGRTPSTKTKSIPPGTLIKKKS